MMDPKSGSGLHFGSGTGDFDPVDCDSLSPAVNYGLYSRLAPAMIYYEVTLQVTPPLARAVEDHMRRQHIPEIHATGCFRRIRFCRASPTRFRTSYGAESAADLERYLREHAPHFRAEFQAAFPRDITVTRETWTEEQSWGQSAG